MGLPAPQPDRTAATPAAPAYTGAEPAVPETTLRPASGGDDYFQVTRQPLPPGATPVLDDSQQVVIGYVGPWVDGIRRIYDTSGHVVGMDEKGLETPLIDPIDLILIVGGIGRIALKGAARAGVRLLGEAAADAGLRAAARTFVPLLRTALRAATQEELRFTATTAARMADPARMVPVQILKLAVRYGARGADPQGVRGAVEYSIEMFRGARTLGEPARRYILRVVLRESDRTVLHFHYSPK